MGIMVGRSAVRHCSLTRARHAPKRMRHHASGNDDQSVAREATPRPPPMHRRDFAPATIICAAGPSTRRARSAWRYGAAADGDPAGIQPSP